MKMIVFGIMVFVVGLAFLPIGFAMPRMLADSGNDPFFGFVFIAVVVGVVLTGIVLIALGIVGVIHRTIGTFGRPAGSRKGSRASF